MRALRHYSDAGRFRGSVSPSLSSRAIVDPGPLDEAAFQAPFQVAGVGPKQGIMAWARLRSLTLNISSKGIWVSWAIIAWTLGVTVARSIRFPNDFSEAHWLLDYRFGFIKRGLIGSLCSAASSFFGFVMSPQIIIGLSVVTFVLLYGALLILIFRLLRRSGASGDIPLLALVFVSSPFVVMNAHLFGYFDALIYFFAIVASALMLANWPIAAACVGVVGLLTHESFLLIGFPLICVASVLRCGADGAAAHRLRHLTATSLPVIVFLGIVLFQSIVADQAHLRESLTAYLQSYDFIPTRAKSVANWHTTGFFQFLEKQRGFLVRRLLEPQLMASLSPALLTLLLYVHGAFRVRPFGKLSLLVIGAVLSPLAMHAIAWDTARISSYVVGGAFIALWIFREARPAHASGGLIALLAVPALLLNVFYRYPLMDKEVERFSDVQRVLLYLPAFLLVLYVIGTSRKCSLEASE